jgi:hypothetical protein
MGNHAAGGVFTKTHTTVIEAANPILEHTASLAGVTKISIGKIDVIKGRQSSTRAVKLIDEGACIRLDITQTRSKQTFWIYTAIDSRQSVKESIARRTRDVGYDLRFRKAK